MEFIIGKITGGAVYWNMGALWVRARRPTDTNAGCLANNWVNSTEISGDHIVEQHVHEYEHEDLLKSIVSGNLLNESGQVALSCATAILGRIAAYTGQTVLMSKFLEP